MPIINMIIIVVVAFLIIIINSVDPEFKKSVTKTLSAFQTAQDNQPYPKAEGCF